MHGLGPVWPDLANMYYAFKAFGQILLFASLAILSKSLNLVEFFWLLCWSSFLAMTKKRIICKAMVTLAISNVFTLSMNNLLPLKSQIPMMYCDLYRWSEPSIKLILTEGLCVCAIQIESWKCATVAKKITFLNSFHLLLLLSRLVIKFTHVW